MNIPCSQKQLFRFAFELLWYLKAQFGVNKIEITEINGINGVFRVYSEFIELNGVKWGELTEIFSIFAPSIARCFA